MRSAVTESLIVFGLGVAVPLVVVLLQIPRLPAGAASPAVHTQPQAVPMNATTVAPEPAPSAPPKATAPANRGSAVVKTPGPTPETGKPTDPFLRDLELGRKLTRWLYGQQTQRLWDAFLPSARASWRNDASAFAAYRSVGQRTYGREVKVLKEEVRARGSTHYYIRTARFARGTEKEWSVIFGVTPDGRVSEFGIVNAAAIADTAENLKQ